MRIRLPFAYEHDRWSEYSRNVTRRNFRSFVEVEIAEVPDLSHRIAIDGNIEPYHSWNGRLYRRWQYVGGGPLAGVTAQRCIDELPGGEGAPDPARFPALPHMCVFR